MMKRIFWHIFFLTIFLTILYLPVINRIKAVPPGKTYTKVHRIFEDYYYYLSVIRQGRGNWAEVDQYTTEKTNPSRVHLFYLFLGKIARITGISDSDAYYGAITVSLIIFYFYTCRLIRLLLPEKWMIPTLLIIYLAAPLPDFTFYLFDKKITTTYGWWTNTDIYHRLSLIPHHFFTGALLIGTVFYFILYLRQKKIKPAIICGLITGTANLFFAVPGFIFLVSVIAACIIFPAIIYLSAIKPLKKNKIQVFFNRQILTGLIIILALSVLTQAFVYLQLKLLGHPWSDNLIWEYNTYHAERFPYQFFIFLSSYGILPYLMIILFVNTILKPTFEKIFLLLIGMMPIILYLLSAGGILTINKIRFVYGAPYVFGGIAAIMAIRLIIGKFHNKLIPALFLFLLFLPNTFISLKNYRERDVKITNYNNNEFIPTIYFEAADFLNGNTEEFSNVLIPFNIGTLLPAYTHNKVYIGHEVSTADFWGKYALSNRFFYEKDMNRDEVQKILGNNRIEYVFWDSGPLPEIYSEFMAPVFRKEHIVIYKTKI